MTMQAAIAAEDTARNMLEAERKIDEAFAAVAHFLGRMPLARMEANLSAGFAHGAIAHTTKCIAALENARREMILAHGILERSQEKAGLVPVNFGGNADKPPKTNARSTVEIGAEALPA